MQLASGRQSFAEEFAEKAESMSSYMLSSRASRHRNLQDEHSDASEEIDQFKMEIQKKYLFSIANKIYTFPYSSQAFESLRDDPELADLKDKNYYCLFDEQESSRQHQPVGGQAKTRDMRNKVHELIEALSCEQKQINALAQYVQNSFSSRQPQSRKSKVQSSLSRDKDKTNYLYGAIKEESDSSLVRRRLNTEPYEKQMGFIYKKK